MDPRELLPLPVSEGSTEEGLTPSPVVCPAGLSSTCPRWVLFTKVAHHDRLYCDHLAAPIKTLTRGS